MNKKLLIAVVVIGIMAFAGVASAANHVGVGYYFEGDHKGLTLKGELALTDRIDVGVDYFGIKNSGWTDIYGSIDLKEFGDAVVGAYAGIRLNGGSGKYPGILVGVWGEQPVHPQLTVYGDAGLGLKPLSGKVEMALEATAGIMADVYAPFWLAGEVLVKTSDTPSTFGFRALVGMDF